MTKELSQLLAPTFTDVLNATKRNLATNINCVQIGIIQDFDATTQTASIQLALKKVLSVAPDGTRTYQERPILLQCPVMVLFGGGSYLTMPIAAGDNCIVLFNDREIDQWFVNGGVQATVTYRAHDLSDAMAIVGLRNLQTSISDYLSNGVRLSFSDNSRINLTNDQIESIAGLFKHEGDMLIDGNLAFTSGKTVSGAILQSSNGVTGTFNVVTVVNGIVTGGS